MKHKTVSNWRWWLCLPVILAMLPIVLAIAILKAIGEWAEAFEDYAQHYVGQMFRWVKAEAKPSQEVGRG